jgi:hypothetical protein
MGDLQPGVGYNLVQSPTGDSLEILFPPQQEIPAFSEYVNQFELKVDEVDIEGTLVKVLRIAPGSHIYRPKDGDCDKQTYTEWIGQNPDNSPALTVVTGTGTGPYTWCNQDGYVFFPNSGSFDVYVIKIETADEVQFAIYLDNVTNRENLCPQTFPPTSIADGIVEPTVPYTVQVLLIGRAGEVESGYPYEVYQNIVGSITWPTDNQTSPTGTNVEQFKTEIESTEEHATILKVARGRVLARCADFVTQTATTDTQSYNYVAYKSQCLKEFNVKNFAVYPDSTLVSGSTASSPWASDNGYIILPDEPSFAEYGVYLVMNQFDASGYTSGAPYLAVIETTENEAFNKSMPYGDNRCDAVEYYSAQAVAELPSLAIYNIYARASGVGASYPFEAGVKNYNCQRVKIATVIGSAGVWSIQQHLIGTLTIPSQFNHMGVKIGIGYDPTVGTTDFTVNDFSSWPLFSSQNSSWNGTWSGYTKAFTDATLEIGV